MSVCIYIPGAKALYVYSICRAFLDELDAAKRSWSPPPATQANPAPTASAAVASARKEEGEERRVQNGEKESEAVGGVNKDGKRKGEDSSSDEEVCV